MASLFSNRTTQCILNSNFCVNTNPFKRMYEWLGRRNNTKKNQTRRRLNEEKKREMPNWRSARWTDRRTEREKKYVYKIRCRLQYATMAAVMRTRKRDGGGVNMTWIPIYSTYSSRIDNCRFQSLVPIRGLPLPICLQNFLFRVLFNLFVFFFSVYSTGISNMPIRYALYNMNAIWAEFSLLLVLLLCLLLQ